MNSSLLSCAIVLLAAAVQAAEIGVRVRFGLEDKQPTAWDGTVTVSQGRVAHLSGWRFFGGDRVNGTEGWKASTHPVQQMGRGNNPARAAALAAARRAGQGPVNDNGVLITFTGVSEQSRVTVTTAQGEFDFTLADIPYGKVMEKLGAAVEIERTGTAQQLSTRRTDDDYPAAAVAPDGTVYVAWVSYTPGRNRDDYNPLEARTPAGNAGRSWVKAPDDFSFLAKVPGGDQIWLRVRRNGTWSEPIAVTQGGGDIYKCTLAVDGAGKAWVCWSENVNWQKNASPNFEIITRSYAGEKLSDPFNLSHNPANDLNPAVASDSRGHVWAAWQGVRDGAFRIVERHQQADGKWSEQRMVSSHRGSCWTPAIAASPSGKVAIAWDTYDKGDYDVWVREYSASSGEASEARAAANSIDYEARPALTYDHSGALWISYELGSPTWGKNFGALVQNQGYPLYRGRQIGLIVWKEGKWQDPAETYLGALPGAQVRRRVNNQRVPAIEPQGESADQARAAELLRDTAYNNLARIVADRSGHIWLFCRSRQNDFRFPVLGSLWLSWAACYDGQKWTGPILLPNSDNLMYNTPSVVALPEGGLLIAHSTDHRQDRFPVRNPMTPEGPDEMWTVPGDPFDNDVYVSRLEAASPAASMAALTPARYPPYAQTAPSEATLAERAAIERCRAQRIEIGGRKLQLIRGEFHRHTEISGDGGNDGPLEDMWRYAIDVAAMDWLGCGDHDNGAGREYTWWLTQKTTDAFRIAGRFEPPFTYERSVRYPEGHRNVIFAQRGVRTLPRLPITDRDEEVHAPDTQMLYTLPAPFRRRLRRPHQRHQHGHRLARQRPGRRADGRDLPGRPPELRAARRAALPDGR